MAGMYGCFKGKNSDSGAMASGAPDVTANQEPAEVSEECSGKKKSKFQTFKKFFARKKKKEASSSGADAELKASQSSDNVSKTSENNTLTRAEKDKGSGSKISLGSKALSHDSVFVSDSSEANEALGASQDSIHGKVKSLQLQLKQAIKLGSPPSLMCVKRTEDAGTMSEDDGLPCSPPEYTSPHTAASQPQRNSSISMEVTDSDEDQLSCPASSRAMSPLLAVPGDFSQPASPFGCLDNSAAKHKLGLRHKACNKRKPANRLEIKAEVDPVVKEILKESSPESVEEPEEPKATGASMVEKKPKVDKEEAEEEEEEDKEEDDEEEEKAQTQHSRGSLLKDKRESEEAEDESDAEQDVSHAPDASSSPELRLSEEEAADGPPQTLFQPTSLDSPRASPEPPAGQTEYLMDPPGIAYGTERSRDESELILGGEEEEEEEEVEEEAAEEESSLLQEVLSSLKTPLSSCSLSLETEGVNEQREKETEDGVEAKEKETEEEEPVGYHEAPSSSLLLGQTTEEEEEDDTLRVSSPSSLDDDEEEEEEVVERFNQHSEKDEKEEVEEPEEEPDLPQAKPETLVGEEERESAQSEGEEEAIELEVEEEEWEVEVECEKEKVEEVEERVEEAQEAMEEEEDRAEEMTETLPDEEEREVDDVTPTPNEGADVVTGEEFVCSRQQSIKTEAEPDEEEPTAVQQSKAASTHISVDEGDDDEERAEEEEESKEQQSDQQDDEEAQQAEEDEDAAQENTDLDPIEEKQRSLSKPPPLSLPEPHSEHQSEEAEPITPSKSSTTILHINLVSPSSEKAPPSFHLPPTPEASPAPAEEHHEEEDTTEEEPAGTAEEEEEGGKQQLEAEEEALPAAAAEADQSKGRFTIAPAWQRSLSGGEAKEDPPTHGSSPSSAGEEPASAAKVDPVPKPAAKPEESSSAAEGNSDNPFGVRLRKTSVLHRFSSEEESSEAPAEPPAQPTSCKVESPPVSVKPSISQPISSKPTLPKKPEILGESGAKNKRISDAAAARGVSSGSGSPSWISVAKQKQKIYKENSLEEITVKKEEQERKSSLPMYVSSAASKEHNSKTLESSSKASMFELSKPSAPPEKEPRRALSPPTPVPAQLPKSQPLPCPVAPKPQPPPTPAKHPAQPPPTPAKHLAQPPPTPAKHPAQPSPSHKPLSPPTPVPPKPCTNPPPSSLPKTAAPPSAPPARSSPLTSPPLPQRTAPPQPAPKPALSGQSPSSQRGLPATALPQDEPPWMALAKKKAKAWSEMPQIVQ